MKILSPKLLLPIVTLAALAACADTVPSGSTALTTSQPVVTSAPATTTTTVVTTGPATDSFVSPFAGSASQTSSTTTTTIVSSPARLSSSEIFALLAGNTASGTASNGQIYVMLFRNDRQLKFREGQFNDRGGWRVSTDAQLCATLKIVDVGAENCYTLSRNGTNIDLGRQDGTKVGSFTVLPGDPQNLVNS